MIKSLQTMLQINYKTLLCLVLFVLTSFRSTAQTYVSIGSSSDHSTGVAQQFLPRNFTNSKVQVLITNEELKAAGLTAGSSIIGLQWYVYEDNTPSTANYDVYITDDYSDTKMPDDTLFITDALTKVATQIKDEGTYTGWHTATFDKGFEWDGTDHMVIQNCRMGGADAGFDAINFLKLQENRMVTRYFDADCNSTKGIYSIPRRPQLRLILKSVTPAKPVITSITDVTNNSFIVNWDAVPFAETYKLDVSLDPNFNVLVSGYSNLNTGNVTSISVTGLTPHLIYYVRLRASHDLTSINSATKTVLTKGIGTITFSNLTAVYDGTEKTVNYTTVPAGLNVIVTYDGITNKPVNVGTYSFTGIIDHENFIGSKSSQLEILKATADVTLSDLNTTYDGTEKSAGYNKMLI